MSTQSDRPENGAFDVSALLLLARELKLAEFYRSSEELLPALDGEALGEVLLARAQLGMLTADPDFAGDLARAGALLPAAPAYPPLVDTHSFLDPNCFIVFGQAGGCVPAFLAALSGAKDLLSRLCGAPGLAAARQIESEILYFSGDFENALAIAGDLRARFTEAGRYDRAMLAGHVLLRCYLATGRARQVEDTMAWVIAWTEKMPQGLNGSIYRTIRAWVNLTTGWGGDTQRYHITPDYEVFPVLEDRAEAMLKGIAQPGPAEAPLIEYAALGRAGTCPVRALYASIYTMLLKYKYGERDEAMERFGAVYPVVRDNGLLMPLAEYGGQIIPFLEYARRQAPGQYGGPLYDRLLRTAEAYEEGLEKYRT